MFPLCHKEAGIFSFEYLYTDCLDCLLVILLDNLNLNIKSHWQQLCVKRKGGGGEKDLCI